MQANTRINTRKGGKLRANAKHVRLVPVRWVENAENWVHHNIMHTVKTSAEHNQHWQLQSEPQSSRLARQGIYWENAEQRTKPLAPCPCPPYLPPGDPLLPSKTRHQKQKLNTYSYYFASHLARSHLVSNHAPPLPPQTVQHAVALERQ